jgi:hypothetical protein
MPSSASRAPAVRARRRLLRANIGRHRCGEELPMRAIQR